MSSGYNAFLICNYAGFSENLSLRDWFFLSWILGFEPKPEFLNESRRLYDSEPAVLESLEQVNNWVEEATNGKMTNFLTAFPPNLLVMLLNAVHFKGEESSCFDHYCQQLGMFAESSLFSSIR